ncbi:GPI inositol-deacylase [Fusarium albosuccineum]|uniref:GPI inositol-deacylase n=1 Tax=Fusarium albosuccineum TaxID=1237068 RepID=A0A8H4KTR8_9HYPO|nr:GPI inositol-deacylase [Fusarium albosuccineum]
MAQDIANQLPSGFGLALVHSPEEVCIDVVFVHGLNGSRSGTWRNSSGDFWPGWLGDSICGSRIWTYGYNSAVWRSPSDDALELHTARLLEECVSNDVGRERSKVIFVCHSLGGILVKSAVAKLLNHSEGASWTYLSDGLASVVFLGTPHRGSEWANRLYLLQLGPRIFWQGSQLVPLLRKGQSGLLATTAERFNNLWGDGPVLTFRETRGITPIGLIVRPEDARTNCRAETCIDVTMNHRRLAKVKSKSAVVYVTIVQHLLGLPEPRALTPSSPVLPSTPASSSTFQGMTVENGYIHSWSKPQLRAFYRGLNSDMQDKNIQWEVLEEIFDPNDPNATPEQLKSRFQAGTFFFCYPGHEKTTVILTVPSKFHLHSADWTILAPNSAWHPGRHDGHLVLPSSFPFKPVKNLWDSPIVSPYVNDYGKTCTDDEYDAWSPALSSFYTILNQLAAIIIYGPELGITTDPTAPSRRPHTLGGLTRLELGRPDGFDAECVRRMTNLFARAYNRPDDDDDLDMFDGGEDDSPLA